MAIYNNLQTIRRLTNASLTSLIDVTNLNFKNLSDANLEFLNNISYDETTNSLSPYQGTFELVNVNTAFTVFESAIPTFTILSNGNATGKSILVEVAETKRQRFTDFPDYPTPGVPGEIIYTGASGLDPVFGEDFIGYLQSQGWVSLTNGGGSGSGVQSVTGLDTDNTDPLNPIIQIAVDGVTIQGDGTPLSPLVAVGGGDFGHKKVIATDEILTIQEDYQYWIYGNFTVDGVIDNYGEIVIANGTLIIGPTGQVNNLGSGLIKIVNLATGTSMQVVVQSFVALAGVPLTITHGLNTRDFVYSVRNGDTLIEVDVNHLDNNSISLISTGDIPVGTIVLQAKI